LVEGVAVERNVAHVARPGLADHAHDGVNRGVLVIVDALLEGINPRQHPLDPTLLQLWGSETAEGHTAGIISVLGTVAADKIAVRKRKQAGALDGNVRRAIPRRRVGNKKRPLVKRLGGWQPVNRRLGSPLENIIIGFSREVAAMAQSDFLV